MYAAGWTTAERLDTWIPIGCLLLLWAVMQWNKKLPSTNSVQEFVAVINSRGGNIVILSIASVYFFKWSMYLFTHLLSMVRDKTITQDNAFALMAIQFVTTSAFGGAMGALLKTMTGESSKARTSDSNPSMGDGVTRTETNISKTIKTISNTSDDDTITPPVVDPIVPPKV